MGLDANCCGENTAANPKKDYLGKRNRSAGMHLFSAKNPIPEEIEDHEELRLLFSRWNFVPFSGTHEASGQSLLAWYLMLAKLSSTHGAAISKKIKYAFGSTGRFVRVEDPQWSISEDKKPLTSQEEIAYRDALNEYIEFDDGVKYVHRMAAKSYEETGNAWVELSFSSVNGVGRAKIKNHKVTHCLYVNTKKGEPKIIAISPIWTDDYLHRNKPRYVPKYPMFEKEPDGTLRTMFHLKNGEGWYGRPESQMADLYKYREVQDAIYLVKQSAANFTGQLIIEVEDENPEFQDAESQEEGYESFADQFVKNYTAKADDPQSVLVSTRPYGSDPMFVFQISPNTNENWYKVTGEMSQDKILLAHGVTRRFMGMDAANGFSTDAFVSDYVMNMEPVISEMRDNITQFINGIVSVIWLELLNKPELNQYSITFTEPIRKAIDEYKTASANSQQPTQPQAIPA